MIKYFSYDTGKIDNECFIKNEMVLYDRPETNQYGFRADEINNKYYIYIIDVEKNIGFYGSLNIHQEVYDKLMLVEVRNKKLETI